MKKALLVGLAIVIVLLLFPLSNLVRTSANKATVAVGITDPHLQEVALAFQEKCMDCHSANTRMPFYARFPIAKGMIEQDVAKGREHLDIGAELFGSNPNVTEALLAKTQKVLEDGSMPPLRYRVLHWGSGLTPEEQASTVAWIRNARAEANGIASADDPLCSNPILPLKAPEGLDPTKVALGRRLFHDNRLSKDNSLSCATCHDLKKGGTDQESVSTGLNEQAGSINSPTVLNAVYNLAQFWDGRAVDLKDQASGPVNNPIEMGSNWQEVLGKLKQDKELVAAFKKIYPDGMTSNNITDAIAIFEKSLVTVNSRFDQYLLGNAGALTADEKEGYRLFVKNGCATCHVGQAMGGKSFEKMGIYRDYFADRGNPRTADEGRFNVTKLEKDRHRFKVPTLRNVALTYPYFHDASAKDLAQAVRVMGKYQIEGPLPDSSVQLMVKYLGTLTGEYEGQPLR
jgi:cytochrome c peroxidase